MNPRITSDGGRPWPRQTRTHAFFFLMQSFNTYGSIGIYTLIHEIHKLDLLLVLPLRGTAIDRSLSPPRSLVTIQGIAKL